MKAFISKKLKFLAIGLLALTLGSSECKAQGPDGRTFGFGLVVSRSIRADRENMDEPRQCIHI